MDKKALMEKLAREAYEKDSFNGTWLYAEHGEIVSKGAIGFRDPEGKLPVQEDTIFQLASVTKQFTAAAVMLLVRQGLLQLDDEIVKFFPELTDYKGATVRHLLTHTSGIPDYFDDADWFIDRWKKENRVPSNPEIVRFLLETEAKPYGVPGETWQYSNTGYNLLAEIVEQRSGIPFEEFLRKNVFEPAGMFHTRCCHVRRDGAPFENYARAAVLEDDKYVADIDSEDAREVIAFDGLNGDDYVYTNIFDMLRWDRALKAGTVLTLEEQEVMYTPVKLNSGEVFVDEDGDGYGFGWFITNDKEVGRIVSHSGGMPGVHTWFKRFLDKDRMLVILCNREEQDIRAHDGLFIGMRDVATGKEPAPIRSIEELAIQNPDKSKWESFCGKYEHPEDADFIIDEVFLRDGDLYANAIDDDGDDLSFRLYPLGENTFGRKMGMVKLTFTEGSITVNGVTCKKL